MKMSTSLYYQKNIITHSVRRISKGRKELIAHALIYA